MWLVTSCLTKEKRGSGRWAMFSMFPVRRLSMQTTSAPLPRRNSQRWEPMKPAPPVTKTRIERLSGENRPAADRVILEAQPPHAVGLVEVPAVEDHGAPHERAQALEVQELELVPLGDEREGGGLLGGLVGRGAVRDPPREEPPGVLRRHRVVRLDRRPGLVEKRHHLDAP